MQTGDRAALCPWASSLWGGQSAVMWTRVSASDGKRGRGGGHHSPTASRRAPGVPSVCGRIPAGEPPETAKASSQRVPGSNPASWHTGQIGGAMGAPLWVKKMPGRAAPLRSTLHLEWPHRDICHRLVSPKERSSACTGAAPTSQSPGQRLARCPGCGQAAA